MEGVLACLLRMQDTLSCEIEAQFFIPHLGSSGVILSFLSARENVIPPSLNALAGRTGGRVNW